VPLLQVPEPQFEQTTPPRPHCAVAMPSRQDPLKQQPVQFVESHAGVQPGSVQHSCGEQTAQARPPVPQAVRFWSYQSTQRLPRQQPWEQVVALQSPPLQAPLRQPPSPMH
jgi:hypothetical protein